MQEERKILLPKKHTSHLLRYYWQKIWSVKHREIEINCLITIILVAVLCIITITPRGYCVVSCCRISFDTYTLGGGVNIKGYNPSHLYQGTIYTTGNSSSTMILLVTATGRWIQLECDAGRWCSGNGVVASSPCIYQSQMLWSREEIRHSSAFKNVISHHGWYMWPWLVRCS